MATLWFLNFRPKLLSNKRLERMADFDTFEKAAIGATLGISIDLLVRLELLPCYREFSNPK
jgi:hypothetical protein